MPPSPQDPSSATAAENGSESLKLERPSVDGTPTPAAVRSRATTPWTLFVAFTQMGLLGFGGVLPWARRVLVDQRQWLTDTEFAELLSVGQILPGPNICNLSLIFGYRQCGISGAMSAFAGLTLLPFIVVVALALGYQQIAQHPTAGAALNGMMAVSAGLVLASGLKLAQSQPRSGRGLILGGAAFVLIGLLNQPLIPVMLALILIALALEGWRPEPRHDEGAP